MNKHDTDNLLFIMSLTNTEFEAWYTSLSSDDAIYASELMLEAGTRVAEELRTLGYAVSDDLVNAIQETPIVDFSQAQSVLSKFTLKGKVQDFGNTRI